MSGPHDRESSRPGTPDDGRLVPEDGLAVPGDGRPGPDEGPAAPGGAPGAKDDVLTVSVEDADLLMARLDALAQAARVFGSGMAGVDVDIGWTLRGGEDGVRWVDPETGRRGARVRLDLARVIAMLRTGDADVHARYVDAFKAGFLHELGHILHSGPDICAFSDPDGDPLACVDLGEEDASVAARPGVRETLRQICLTLEDARVERRLADTFRGARRFLEGHADQALETAHGVRFGTGGVRDLERLVAVLFLQVWGLEERIDRALVPGTVLSAADRLRESLAEVAAGAGPASPVGPDAAAAGTVRLATWVGRHLLPEIRDHLLGAEGGFLGPAGQTGAGEEGPPPPPAGEGSETPTEPGSAPRTRAGEGEAAAFGGERVPGDRDAAPVGRGAPAGTMAEDLRVRFQAPDLLTPAGGTHRLAAAGPGDAAGPLESRIIAYPHVDGRMVLDEVAVAQAAGVAPDPRTDEVARDVVEIYGPMAMAAFASEAAALRRAFQVNFERRFGGRYRSGKRVGVANIRRFVTREDLRLFQKMEVPDRLSYYFHLLVDVSPSMFTNKNAQKAVATAYAFADALVRLRVPVDVTLYSSAVTVLHDHRAQALDLFFGGRFGYLSSGTHEIEAIAYAKLRAEAVVEERKILVVLTDGQPNSLAVRRAGAADLKAYYQGVLIPWLTRSGVDLMAIGIGTSPGYHRDSVTVSSSWESIGVLMALLDDIVARGERSHSALWA